MVNGGDDTPLPLRFVHVGARRTLGLTHLDVWTRPPLAGWWPGEHLVLVDSSDLPGRRGRADRYENELHAKVIAELLRTPDVLACPQGRGIAVAVAGHACESAASGGSPGGHRTRGPG